MKKVSVAIVTHNSIKYLPDFLDSVLAQTYFLENNIKPEVIVVDNASSDKTVNFIKDNFPTVCLLRNVNNIGLPRAWNQAIQMTTGEYLLIMNPDLILDKDHIKHAVKILDEDQTVATVGGKLYRLKISNIIEGELAELEKTNIIDSCGLRAYKNRRFIDRGSGTIDKGHFSSKEEIFGISGSCILYRRSALEQVKFCNQYFDEDFFMYKEEIDMAWRLRLAGWTSIYTPDCIGWHHRRARSQEHASDLSIIKNRRQKQDFVNFHSYKNHLLLLLKNELPGNYLISESFSNLCNPER